MKLIGKFTVKTSMFPNKNPKGYTRSTQRGYWDKSVIEYEKWKDWVAKCFLDQCGNIRVNDKAKVKLDVMIYYFNNRKSDPSNVFKGIEDALADKKHRRIKRIEKRLYKNDNYTIGKFDFAYDKEDPRVEIKIYL